jgi:hypothetical protein
MYRSAVVTVTIMDHNLSTVACSRQELRDIVASGTSHEMRRLSAGLKVENWEFGGELSLRYSIDWLDATILHLTDILILKYVVPYHVQSG